MIGKMIGTLTGVVTPEQWFIDFVNGGRRTASGERINEQTALTSAAVLACVKILAETLASLPLDVYRRLPNGDKLPATDHPVHRLLHTEPNPDTSSFIFRETLQSHLGTWGNGYAEIERAFDGTPLALHQRSPKPHHTKPDRRDDVDGKLWYRCRNDAGAEEWIKSRNMLHVPGMGFDGQIGYSPVSLMKESIGLNKAAERYAAELFANDARPNGVISMEGELSKEAYDRLKKSFNESASEHGKRHKIQLLEGNATYTPTQMNPKDVQMIEARRFGIEEVARAYRISLHLLQEFTEGAASYASIVELGREFIVYTMMPWLKRWEGEINRKLLDENHFAEFNVAAFMQGDHVARSQYYYKGLTTGQFSINEIRRLENMNAIGPEGDERFVPANVVPLKQAIKEPEPKQPPPFPPKGEGGDEPEEKPGDEDEEKQQRAETAPVLHARLDRMEDTQQETITTVNVEDTQQEIITTVNVTAADSKTVLDERCDQIQEQVAALEGVVVEQGEAGRALSQIHCDQIIRAVQNSDKDLAERIKQVGHRLDKQVEFGQMAHVIAERQLRAKEGKAAVREAAKGGNFLEWMEGFYENHVALCVEKFGLAAAMLGVPAGSLAQMHVRESRKLLLTATECKADKLVESVTACVAKWGQRELNTEE